MLTTDLNLLRALAEGINKCKKCHGTDLSCTCRRKYNHELAKIKAHIPAKYRNYTLSDIKDPASQKIVQKIERYIVKLDVNKQRGSGLYLHGNPGTAKSTLGSVILMNALTRRYTGYFTTAKEFLELSVTKRDDPEARTIVKYLTDVDFLLIDDLGREYRDQKGFVESQLDELIRYRTDNLLPTIITTNKPKEVLAADNFRLMSILQEHFVVIPFVTKDYRPQIGAQLQNEKK